jgi:hypothetical protein
LVASGLVVEDNHEVGVLARDEGTQIEIDDCVVRRTLPHGLGTFGRGVEFAGATARGKRLLITHNTEAGVYAGRGSIQLTDVLIAGVTASRRGLGIGVLGVRGCAFEGDRVALQDTLGAATTVVSDANMESAALILRDFFARDVGHSTLRFSDDGQTIVPELPFVSYGLHAGNASVLDVSRATLLNGGHGFFNAGGTLRVQQGVFANYSRLGATTASTPASATTLVDVTLHDTDSTIERNSSLPSATLPRPTDPPPAN